VKIQKNFLMGLLFLLVGGFTTSCNYYQNKATLPATANSTQKGGPDFETVRLALFEPKCTECHRQYASYAGVLRELPSIQSAISSNRMPKRSAPLDDSLRALLNNWIRAGAPEKAGTAEPQPPPEPTELVPTWTSISENILLPKCVVCHNPTGEAKFLDLSNRRSIFDSRDRVFSGGEKLINFEEAEKSYLIQILKDEEEPMPPPYSKIERLEPNQIEVFTEWIRQGLP
jgi:hypothetical protein